MKIDLVIELAPAAMQALSVAPIVRMLSLETLIARGDPFEPPASSCDASLVVMFGYDAAASAPNAALYALGEGLSPQDAYWLRADPVCLMPTTARLTLSELPADALTNAESQALSAALNEHFADDDFVLFAPHPQRWYLRLQHAPVLETLSPAACAGTLEESDLPSGRDGAKWKRMITEAQMLLNSHPINVEREAQGKLPANAVWPWAGGRLPAPLRRPTYASVYGEDLLLRALAGATGIPRHPLPQGARAIMARETADSAALVVLRMASTSGSNDLTTIEQQWASPLRAAIEGGQLADLTITLWGPRRPIARHITRRHLGRWWRRRRPLHLHD